MRILRFKKTLALLHLRSMENNGHRPATSRTENRPSRKRGRRGSPRGIVGHRRNRPRDLEIFRDAAEMRSTYTELGTKHNLSRDRIAQIIRNESERVADELTQDRRAEAARQTAALKYIVREAISAFHRSQEPHRSITKWGTAGRAPDPDNENGNPGSRFESAPVVHEPGTETGHAVETIRSQAGDPRHLEVALKALADIRKIWGLESPIKVDLSATVDVRSVGERLEEVTAELQSLLPAVSITDDAVDVPADEPPPSAEPAPSSEEADEEPSTSPDMSTAPAPELSRSTRGQRSTRPQAAAGEKLDLGVGHITQSGPVVVDDRCADRVRSEAGHEAVDAGPQRRKRIFAAELYEDVDEDAAGHGDNGG